MYKIDIEDFTKAAQTIRPTDFVTSAWCHVSQYVT